MATKEPTIDPSILAVAEPSADLKRLHELCAFHCSSLKELSLLQARIEREFTALLGRHKDEALELKNAADCTLKAVEELLRQHPEWLGEKRNLVTPFGTLKLTLTRSLDIPDEEKTFRLLMKRAEKVPGFDAAAYFHQDTVLHREALEKLDNKTLKRLGIVRVEDDSFSFKALKVDVIRALQSLPKSEQAAA